MKATFAGTRVVSENALSQAKTVQTNALDAVKGQTVDGQISRI